MEWEYYSQYSQPLPGENDITAKNLLSTLKKGRLSHHLLLVFVGLVATSQLSILTIIIIPKNVVLIISDIVL